jgi:poly(3-hydroxybutyrate) depolymerase
MKPISAVFSLPTCIECSGTKIPFLPSLVVCLPAMNIRKIVIRVALVLIGVAIVLVLLLVGVFYSIFYFPNWTTATTKTIISSGKKREYLLYVPKSYDPAKPTPLVITLHTAMSWDSAAMAISQWNRVADEHGFIVAYPEGTGFGPKSWEMAGSETPGRMSFSSRT